MPAGVVTLSGDATIKTRLVLVRGDTRDITLTMPAGSALLTSEVRFSVRACADDDDAIWAKVGGSGVTVSSNTVAVASINEADWETWSSAGEPAEMAFDWEVRAGGVIVTPALGTIRVVWDVTRA